MAPRDDPSTLYPHSVYGSLGAGTGQFIDAGGEFQAVPNTGTPPFGEPPLYTESVEAPYPLDPMIDPMGTEDWLHEQMHGASYRRGYIIQRWVNPSNPGVPNLGPVNEQPDYSGHSQITAHNPAAEQGWGMDPAVLLARFPHSEGVNPFYALGTHRRNGQLEFTSAGLPFGNVVQQQHRVAISRQRSTTHQRLVDNPTAVPYSSTITPVPGQAGPFNLVPEADEAIYE